MSKSEIMNLRTPAFSFHDIPVRARGLQERVAQSRNRLVLAGALLHATAGWAQTAVEFYHPQLKHYFLTALSAEVVAIEQGAAGAGWIRTGETFLTAGTASGATPVCRFYASGPSSHFYTADAAECAWLRQLESEGRAVSGAAFSGWAYEGVASTMRRPQNGACAEGNPPVFRYYNQRAAQNDSNHRFSTNPVADEAMRARDWADEGTAFCAEIGSVLTAASRDCGSGMNACPLISPLGDPPDRFANGQPSNFSGYADPTVRKDPSSNRLWMAYSWPRVHTVSASEHPPGVDIHLAASDDGGASWVFQQTLWASSPVTEPWPGGRVGWEDHEVANLLPVDHAGQKFWVGARLDYFVPNSNGVAGRGVGSFRIRIGRAASPPDLAAASLVSLGGSATQSAWGVDLNLSTLASGLAKCYFYNEPALHYRQGQLYLALRCHAFTASGVPDVAASEVVMFSSTPEGAVSNWRWRFVGRLAGDTEGEELGGKGVTQIDLATGASGKLLAVLSPEDWSSALKEFVHYGCRLIEVASLDPPTLARHADGTLKVLARATASDLATYGPAPVPTKPLPALASSWCGAI